MASMTERGVIRQVVELASFYETEQKEPLTCSFQHTFIDTNTMTTSKISQQDDKVTPRHARRTGPAYQILRRETSALGQDIPSAVATTQCNLPHKPSPHIRSSNKRPPRLCWAGPEALFSAMGTAVRDLSWNASV